jgi:crotonobetainyl-CoA:carnitine CoA-transferase CaiB-like acyl-CoA transferase
MTPDGIKVIDLISFATGSAVGRILADFGADVIKIKPPVGDPNHKVYQLPELPKCAHNYVWAMPARCKRSLELDLKTSDGTIVKRLPKDTRFNFNSRDDSYEHAR